MSPKRIFRLVHSQARKLAAQYCQEAADGWIVTFAEPTRNLDQNAAQWPILEAFAEQAEISINGAMCKITSEEWKDVLTAVFRGESGRVAHWEGKMILIGARTSKFKVHEFSDWLEFLHATAAIKGVIVYPEDVRLSAPERLAA